MILCHNMIVILSISSLLCVQAQNGIRDHYRFNHPPSIETFESVAQPSTVAAVNKRGEAREEKSFKLSTNFQTTSEEESKPTENNDEALSGHIRDTSSEAAETEKLENNNKRRNFSNRKSSIRQNLEIPVNVVYDADSEVVYSNKRNEQSRNRSTKRRKQIARRLQKSKFDESAKDAVSIDDDKLVKEKSFGNTDNNESPKSLSIQNNPINTPSPISTEERRRMRTRPPVVPIINEMNFVYAHSGNFHYSFEGGDGTKVFEEGSLKTINEDTGEAVHGGFSYTDKEGNDFSLSYTADENGYRPVGAHLPTPPPIPPAIARALAYLATKPVPQATEATELA